MKKLHHLENSITKRACRFLLCSLVIATAAGPLAYDIQAGTYVYTNIADSSGIFAKYGDISANNPGLTSFSLSNSGTVAFAAYLDDGSNGVFVGNGGPVTPVALSSGPMFSAAAFRPSINSAGMVAFVGLLDGGGAGIFNWNNGITTPVVTSAGEFSAFDLPSINDAGAVAFAAMLDAGDIGIFRKTSGTITTIALESGPIFANLGTHLSLNSGGEVSFAAIRDAGDRGVFKGSGGPITTVALTGLVDGLATISINDPGTVVFSISSAILAGNGGSLMTIADISGPYGGFGIHPAINNSGTVAFLAELDFGFGRGVYVGPNPATDNVIRVGDPLFGSTVANIQHPFPVGEFFGDVDINDAGQVAFYYQLANGREGIAVATPVIPEPCSLLLFLAGAMFILSPNARRPGNKHTQSSYGTNR